MCGILNAAELKFRQKHETGDANKRIVYVFIVKIMKYPIYSSLSYNPPTTSKTRPTSVAVTSDALLLVLLASRAHAHDLLLVSVLVSDTDIH
jgi:hypothetical protein